MGGWLWWGEQSHLTRLQENRDDCKAQVVGHQNARYKKFTSRAAADAFVAGIDDPVPAPAPAPGVPTRATAMDGPQVVYCDGASRNNGNEGAKAGFGVFFGPDDERNTSERLEGPIQTNGRAEAMARVRIIVIIYCCRTRPPSRPSN